MTKTPPTTAPAPYGRPYPRREELAPWLTSLGDKMLAAHIGLSREAFARVVGGLPTNRGTHALCDRFLDAPGAT